MRVMLAHIFMRGGVCASPRLEGGEEEPKDGRMKVRLQISDGMLNMVPSTDITPAMTAANQGDFNVAKLEDLETKVQIQATHVAALRF